MLNKQFKPILILIIFFLNFALPAHANFKENFKEGIKEFFLIGEKYLTDQEIEEEFINDNFLPALNEICDLHKQAYLLDDKNVQKGYKEFLENKNNMYKNRLFYENVNFWANDNKKILDYQLDKLFKEHEFYSYKSKYGTYKRNCLMIKREKLQEIGKQQIDEIYEMYAKWQRIADEVYHYSLAYESKKKTNYYKNKYGVSFGGNLDFLLVAPYGGPEIGKYYTTYMYLTVTQTIPGGVIVSSGVAPSVGYKPHFKHAFIVTNKNYVTRQNITGRFKYIGTYSYINSLNSKITVWKFVEIAPPTEKFYFIGK